MYSPDCKPKQMAWAPASLLCQEWEWEWGIAVTEDRATCPLGPSFSPVVAVGVGNGSYREPGYLCPTKNPVQTWVQHLTKRLTTGEIQQNHVHNCPRY